MHPNIHFQIDAKSAAYIRTQGAALTIRQSPRHGCCGGTVLLPIAELGSPPSAAGWHVYQQEGISIYLSGDLALAEGAQLRIGVDRLLGLHNVWLESDW